MADKRIRAGDRRCWVQIQTRTVVNGIVTWPARGAAWGRIAMLRGTEQIEAKQLMAGRVGRINFAYSPMTAGIRPVDRLQYGARVFQIQSAVNLEERNREIEVLVVEQA